MKWLFILLIKTYWYLIPEEKRNSCIFSQSCSNHVMSALKEKGVWSGLKALLFRYNNCRKGYRIIMEGENLVLLTVNNQKIEESNVRKSIIDAHNNRCHSITKSASDSSMKFSQ